MRLAAASLALLLLAAPRLEADPFAGYDERTGFLLTPPASQGLGLLGYDNPAILNYVESPEAILAWSDAPARREEVGQWGVFAGLPHLGFGVMREESRGRGLHEYRLSCSGGGRRLGFGLGYGWATGHTSDLGRHRHLALGTLFRPGPWLSAGATLTAPVAGGDLFGPGREAAVEVAVRPPRMRRLTLFADGSAASEEAGGARTWSAGAALTTIPGLTLTGRFFDNRTVSFGVHLGLDRLGVATQSRFDRDRSEAHRTCLIRLGSREPNLVPTLSRRGPRYLSMELRGPLRHRRLAFFDRGPTLTELVGTVRRICRDPGVDGLAVDLSGIEVDPVMAWEVRSLLQQLRDAGKEVVVYLDRADLYTYHLASVASTVVLDPAGMIVLDGVVSGRTYFRGALERLGIGFEEWRLFEYKSALESLTREGMSPADREQEQALVDDRYALVREEVSASRGMTAERFDRLVDEETLFLPAAALERGLVDRLGRWERAEELLRELEGPDAALTPGDGRAAVRDDTWGSRPRLAVVYALGVCDVEEGMQARRLAEELAQVRDDREVRAVVLRVDSPGGDVLASDLVADAVQQCREQKPVIVSQAMVAASGGYWVSMYGDSIVAAPNTITGSIGVIGGWVYDQGLKEELGLSTDHVQAGAHADLGFGMRLFGLELPDRNLTAEERTRVDAAMRTLYDDFVAKVATGRRSTVAAIDSVGRGRVWSGRRALEHGLVDRLGGLDTALRMAASKAGLDPGRPMELVERPRLGLRDFTLSRAGFPELRRPPEETLAYLRFRLDHNGQPLLLLPTDGRTGFLPRP